MNAICIQNLRSLADTGFIELKPLTLLVGENGSGKSTFLRALPLLKQSVRTRTRGPILWSDQVDFGSFEEARNKNSQEKEIVFHFQFQPSPFYDRVLGERNPIVAGLELTITLKLINDIEGWTQAKACFLAFADHRIQIVFGKHDKIEKFTVNNHDFKVDDLASLLERNGLIPLVVPEPGRIERSLLPRSYFPTRSSKFLDRLVETVRGNVHKNTGDERIVDFIQNLIIGSSEQMLTDLKTNPKATETWHNNVANWSNEHEDFQYLRDLILANYTFELLQLSNLSISQFANNISYIAPVRAYPNRDYRLQDFAVDEVDFDGRNLPMFLYHLTDEEQKRFGQWTEKLFGFSARTHLVGNRLAINIRQENSSETFNLADTGFGFSQILPIVAQLWSLVYQRQSKPPRFIGRGTILVLAVEQPELHLHPRLQAKLADAFQLAIQEARKNKRELRLVLETHSQTIVNRLGHHIAEGHIQPEEVNVVLFEKEQVDGPTTVRATGYDHEGYLQDWPLGFFLPDEIA